MIVVDSSTWIGYLRDRPTDSVLALDGLIRDDADLATTDLIMAELLRGARSERDAGRLDRRLSAFPMLMSGGRYIARSAGRLYRAARGRGFTVHSTIDCLIAAVCLRDDAALLHEDADFDRLAAVVPLRLHPTGTGQGAVDRRA